MTTRLEEQLRAELGREGARVRAADLRPLVAPRAADGRAGRPLSLAASVSGALGRPRPGRSRTARLAPAAAVIAVLAVIAGIMVAGAGARHPSGTGPAGTSNPAAMPRFYVSVSYPPRVRAVVHDARTGRVLSSVLLTTGRGPLPADPAIAAAAGGRSFAIAVPVRGPGGQAATRVRMLYLTRDGGIARTSQLPLWLTAPGSGTVAYGLALSGDGTRLAATIQVPAGRAGYGSEIKVVSLAPGYPTRTWTTGGQVTQASDPAWQAGGRYLGFLLWSHIRHPAHQPFTARSQVRLLDTAAAGRDLLATPVIAAGGPGRGFLADALLSPDGRSVTVAAYRNVAGSRARHGTAYLAVEELAVPGSRVRHQVCVRSEAYGNPRQEGAIDDLVEVLAVAPRGRHSLVVCPGMARLDNGRFTPLPGLSAYGVAW